MTKFLFSSSVIGTAGGIGLQAQYALEEKGKKTNEENSNFQADYFPKDDRFYEEFYESDEDEELEYDDKYFSGDGELSD